MNPPGHIHGLSSAPWAWTSEERSGLEIQSESSVLRRTPAESNGKLDCKRL